MRIVLTGGGTAGHVTPHLALIPPLQREGWDIHYIGSETGIERELIGKVRDIYNGKMFVQCTACAYCMPCPRGVNIPGIFRHMNDGALAEDYKRSREHYADEIADGTDAGRCVGCGKCETHCPQGLPIREKLKQAHEILK